ncbi:Fic family protein [Candidatus Dependentiae bacterium]|nr:Fic family protein [Candidatus Dependentiae bacterium]
MQRITGRYQSLGNLTFFIPENLPPKKPPLELAGELAELYAATLQAITRLNEMAEHIPNAQRFIKAYIIKEAMLSSAIENINTTMVDVFTETLASGSQHYTKETQLILNYDRALHAAVQLIRDQQMPITTRLICQTHAMIMNGESHAGTFRQQTVRVGQLIPAPPQEIPALMAALETFMNTNNELPPLIQAGLAHVQFETIHPFLDGNGRMGRMLIILMLIESTTLTTAILYPSYAFKKRQTEYYQYLDRVRTQSDFEGWIRYYLQAMQESAIDAYQRTGKIQQLDEEIRTRITTEKQFSRIQSSALEALSLLFELPVINSNALATRMACSYNTAAKLISLLVDAKLLQEITGYKRNKLYQFKPYLELLER